MDYKPKEILSKYWGYNDFRPLQEDIIDSVLAGSNTVALLPTGGGKSICFQIPILCHHAGVAVVISPLIALMEDQVHQLKKRNIKAIALSSKLNKRSFTIELDNIINGAYRIVYLSPERLSSSRILESIIHWNVKYIAVDEAHCISQWGFDFRPSYLQISGLVELLRKPIIAVTATATPRVIDDINDILLFDQKKLFTKSFLRDNISITIQHSEQKLEDVIHLLNHVDGSAILYLRNRLGVEKYAKRIKARGISVDYYHAGLSTERRDQAQYKWITNEVRLIVCTNAFGMGIDKSNVRLVIHLDVAPSIEEYYQEIGRAGRDGLKSYAVSLLNNHDLAKSLDSLDYHRLKSKELYDVYDYVMRLNDVAIHDGVDRVLSVDIGLLATKFNINATRIEKILEAIQRLGLWELSKHFESSSSMKVLASTAVIRSMDKESLQHKLIQYLLRRFQNVLHAYVKVEELKIASVLKVPQDVFKKLLIDMTAKKLISYIEKSNNPKLYLAHSRIRRDVFLTLAERITRTFQSKKNRLKSIHDLINTNECRQKTILTYFGEKSSDCGICDSCLINGISLEQKSRLENIVKQKQNDGYSFTEILKTVPFNKRRLAMEILKSI